MSADTDPVVYTVRITHHQDGDVDVDIQDVGHTMQDRKAVAWALRKAAELVESPSADVVTKDLFN